MSNANVFPLATSTPTGPGQGGHWRSPQQSASGERAFCFEQQSTLSSLSGAEQQVLTIVILCKQLHITLSLIIAFIIDQHTFTLRDCNWKHIRGKRSIQSDQIQTLRQPVSPSTTG